MLSAIAHCLRFSKIFLTHSIILGKSEINTFVVVCQRQLLSVGSLQQVQHCKIRTSSLSMVKYLNQKEAIQVDLDLFNEFKFDVIQLMELAGLSCAHAITKCFSAETHKRVFICCGPGNNGGDGLVCARHLALMQYKPKLYYPQPTHKDLFDNLVHQCECMNIDMISECPSKEQVNDDFDLIVDALFGFSFKPPVREVFVPILTLLQKTKLPIASVDIPSGWDVECGKQNENDFEPTLLISLTAPKMCAKSFKGAYHYLGGRFIPPKLQLKYKLDLPQYHGNELCVKL